VCEFRDEIILSQDSIKRPAVLEQVLKFRFLKQQVNYYFFIFTEVMLMVKDFLNFD